MKMTKQAGPWRVAETPNAYWGGWIVRGPADAAGLDGPVICTANTPQDAELIAAAPRLEHCLYHLEKELQAAFDDVPAGVDAWMAEARIALAQAKGEQP